MIYSIECCLCFIVYLIGVQLYLPDLKLLTGRYNYKIGISNTISIFAAITLLCVLAYDYLNSKFSWLIGMSLFILIFSVLREWFFSKINTYNQQLTLLFHILSICVIYAIEINFYKLLLSPFFLIGIYNRNCPFGAVHRKNFVLSVLFKRHLDEAKFHKKLENEIDSFQSNFLCAEKAGSGMKQDSVYNVADFGIIPNTKKDWALDLQKLIDKVGLNGGGTIFFPKGKYYFNQNKKCPTFLQLNYSNVRLQGELGTDGKHLSVLHNCNPVVDGKKNPWLSPFFITTGEKIQQSNMFWGLQFKKKKNITTRSGSLADPGSDGTILTPSFKTTINQDCLKESRILSVDSTDVLIGVKYIMIGLYNSTEDGDLIKNILDMNELRPEWGTANRAGTEVAPSIQWLVEIEKIIDGHRIEITQPLRFDCLQKYSPAIFAVEMLENIEIKDLKLSCSWNGLFRHHGFPLYYSIAQSQEMDYGWNAINIKRVAHGLVQNIVIENYSNPLYILDSRNILVDNLEIKGHDGHQGIKIYEHACDNKVQNVTFRNNYADMLGGEGNAYGNIFSNIRYVNPIYSPVDFDFHGFSEGPMSPPAYNKFENIYGFRYIKAAGALYNQPACAQSNAWINILGEGERKGSNLFISLPYVPKNGFAKYISALRHAFVVGIQKRSFAPSSIKKRMMDRIEEMDQIAIPPQKHWTLFPNSLLVNYQTSAKFPRKWG